MIHFIISLFQQFTFRFRELIFFFSFLVDILSRGSAHFLRIRIQEAKILRIRIRILSTALDWSYHNWNEERYHIDIYIHKKENPQ